MIRPMTAEGVDPRIVRLRKAMHYCDLYRLSRTERIDLSEIILRRDVPSWSTLSVDELGRLLDAFEGHALIQHLLDSRE